MNTTLKVMLPLRQSRDLELASLKDARSGHRDFRKAAGALGSYFLAWPVQARDEAATEFCNLGEGVRLAALIDGLNDGSFLDCESVRFEVPVRIRRSSSRFRKQR